MLITIYIIQEPKSDQNTTNKDNSGQPRTQIHQHSIAPLKLLSIATICKLVKDNFLPHVPGLPTQLSSMIRCITTENICNINNTPAKCALNYLSKKHLCVLAGGYVAHKLGLTRCYADIDIYVFVDQKQLDDVFRESIDKIYRRETTFAMLTPDTYQMPLKFQRMIISDYLTEGKCKVVFIPLDDSNSSLTLYKLCSDLVHNFDLDICKCVGIFAHNIGSGLNEGDILYFSLAPSFEFVDGNEKQQFLNILGTITNGIHSANPMDPFYDGDQGLDPYDEGDEFDALRDAVQRYVESLDEYDSTFLSFTMFKNFLQKEQVVLGMSKPKDYVTRIARWIKRWSKYNLRVNTCICTHSTQYHNDVNITNFFMKNV